MPTWNGNLHRLPLKKNTDLCLATSVLGPKCCLRPAPLAPVSETSAGFAPRLWFWPEPATRTSLEPSQPNSSFFDQSPLTISEQRSSQLLLPAALLRAIHKAHQGFARPRASALNLPDFKSFHNGSATRHFIDTSSVRYESIRPYVQLSYRSY